MTKKQLVTVWGLIIGVSILLNIRNFNNPLNGRHAWAQADHFAIALNFIDNNFDFFHPETYCLNPQFSADVDQDKNIGYWSTVPENPQGITAVDFPINPYIVAGLMSVFETKEVLIYRLYTLIICMLGLFYLFKTSLFVTKSYNLSLFLILFVLLSPTYSYYSFSTLPSPVSLSLLFIASFHFAKYFLEGSKSNFNYSLCFFTLASLIRFPFIIYLLSLVCLLGLSIILKKKKYWKQLIVTTLAIAIVLGYFFYNKFYLSKNFGSNFLSYPLLPKSISEFLAAIYNSFYHESWRYFTLAHYAVLFYILKQVFKNRSKKITKNIELTSYLIIASIGVSIYAFLMTKQFIAHDYYLLDTFFPILLFWMIGSHLYLKKDYSKQLQKATIVFGAVSIIFSIPVFIFGYNSRPKTLFDENRRNFVGSHHTLDRLKISKKAKILLLDSHTPNLNFIGLQRKGFCVMTPSEKLISRAMNWNYDYIITPNESIETTIIPNYPNFKKETEVFYSNKGFTIHTKK